MANQLSAYRRLAGALIVCIAAVFSAQQASAGLMTKNFSWVGNAGYTAQGVFTYEDSIPTVSADGLGATTGLEEWSVSFFDPGATLLSTFDNVTGGISSYEYLDITFDTASMLFSGTFDVGKDDQLVGDYYFYGTIGGGGLKLYQAVPGLSGNDIKLDESRPSVITVTGVPVPATLALFGLGLVGLGWSTRKQRS